ncbi:MULTISPECIES: hypothetical protein [Pseudofrankia]|uniref:hypothetical protein n=1 Tax=Pseudofrankia TaxID=2994363 RepID=UPI000234CFF0|nr:MULTISPECIES: hypothetical protein [Pseudofrankia]
MIRLTERACAALRDGEVIVFDWAALGLCCGCTGQPWLRTAPRAVALKYRGFRSLDADPVGSSMAHPLAYPWLLGRDVAVDCRFRLGFRRFSCDLPQDIGLTELFGRAAAGSVSAGSVSAGPVPAGSVSAGPVPAGSVSAGPVREGSVIGGDA